LIVFAAGKEALALVLMTFVGAIAAVAGLEIGLLLLRDAGFQSVAHLIPLRSLEGFSQNRNSFALQLLTAISVVFVFARGGYVRVGLLTLMFTALWFAGSRSGWIALACLIGTAFYLRATSIREIGTATVCAASIALIDSLWSAIPAILPSSPSTHERLTSLLGGLKLFAAHPIFGAGLGAFQNEKIPGDRGFLVIHSIPVWLLAELGIVGFLAFAAPALYVFVTEWRCARKDQASAIIVLCFIAFAVMSGPADMLYQRTFWLLVGTALAVTPSIVGRQSTRQPDPPARALNV
jgi:O-antigen ligase